MKLLRPPKCALCGKRWHGRECIMRDPYGRAYMEQLKASYQARHGIKR